MIPLVAVGHTTTILIVGSLPSETLRARQIDGRLSSLFYVDAPP